MLYYYRLINYVLCSNLINSKAKKIDIKKRCVYFNIIAYYI